MRADDLGRSIGARRAGDDRVTALGKADAFGTEADFDAFRLENFTDGRGDIFVLALEKTIGHFEDRHLTAKAAKHLAELEADVAAADDDEVLRQVIHLHYRAVGEVRHLPHPRHFRNHRASAHIDENAIRRDSLTADAYFPQRLEARVAQVNSAVVEVLQPRFDASSRFGGDVIFPRFYALHVDGGSARQL